MQGPAINAGMPFPTQPLQQSRASGQGRLWTLALVSLLIIALIAIGMGWLQWASQRSLSMGYPAPNVQMTTQIPGNLVLNQSYQFSAASQGRDVTYIWDFGDQTTSSGPVVNHAFQSSGNYTVTVRVTDAIGQKSTASTQVTVLPPPPQATFTYSVGYYGYVAFDASNSTADPGTSIAYYDWNFGDGLTDHTSSSQDSHSYSSYGTYTVTLTVTDATGQQSTAYSATVSV